MPKKTTSMVRPRNAHSDDNLKMGTYFGFYLELSSHLLYDLWSVCGAQMLGFFV
jgi:hypothetical protein